VKILPWNSISLLLGLSLLASAPVYAQVQAQEKNALTSPISRPDAPPLALRGGFQVGVKTLKLSDATRKRDFTLEVWYPAKLAQNQLEATVYSAKAGALDIQLPGQALRDAAPSSGKYPLIIVSHGQPGSRYALTYLTEALAARGFVVAALDHTGSTYADLKQESYVSSIVDRPLDVLYTLEALPKLIPGADGQNVGLLGYSYGGYTSLNAAGVALSKADLESYCKATNNEGPCFTLPFFDPLEAARGAKIKPDPRIKAVMVMAPYGAPWFSKSALESMKVPLFVGGGSADDIATYARDAKVIFERSSSQNKYLLTLEGALHNPWVNPAPVETYGNFKEYERWSEPVWDKQRTGDIVKHFASAFFGSHLKADKEALKFLSSDLPGFLPRTTQGIKLELGK
jgi:predicted dienelactone hydrolase